MEEHEEYALMRNEKFFGFIHEDEDGEIGIEDEYVDFVNTVSWIWKQQRERCNYDVLQFMNVSICAMNVLDDFAVYIKHDEEEENEVMNVRNMRHWDEIYHIDMSAENHANNQKLCRYASMIKLCVELSDEQYQNGKIKEMQISVEF